MSNATIRQAFETRLQSWASAQTPPVQIAFENARFAPQSAAYLRVTHLPNRTRSDDLAGVHRRYEGLIQVDACMPVNQGAAPAMAIEAALAAAFPVAVQIVHSGMRIYVTSPLSAGPAFADKDRHIVPMTLAYRADTI